MSLRDEIALVSVEIDDAVGTVHEAIDDPDAMEAGWVRVREAMEARRKLV
jgi:hypothetical protein